MLNFSFLAAILSFTYSELCHLTMIYVITLFVFITIYVIYSSENSLNLSISILILTVLLLRFFEQEGVLLFLQRFK